MAVSRKGQIDMTIGHIMKNIILFAIPIIIGNDFAAVIYNSRCTCNRSILW